MFHACHHIKLEPRGRKKLLARIWRMTWPDNESWLEQETYVCDMFALISDEYMEAVARG
jgi:hypothetical protein